MPKIQANGIEINYEEIGSGFPMIWIHGGLGTLRDWEEQASYFENRYRVICYDARGHGGTTAPEDPNLYSQDISVEDLRSLIDVLDIAQAYIGGLSMGGNIALNFAIKYPARARGIVVADTGAGSDDPAEHLERMRGWARIIETQGMEGMKKMYFDLMLSNRTFRDAAIREKVARKVGDDVMVTPPPGAVNSLLRTIGVRPTIYALEPQLKALQVPVLVIVGDQDWTVGPSRFIAEKVSNAQLVVIPIAGHNTHMEAPQDFNEAVDQFVRTLEG